MFSWVTITSLGNVTNMAVAAAAIAVSMIAHRAWRIALWWCLLLLASTLLVVATKIAFIGWGVGIAPLDFKGFSGHSMRASAIIPVIFYLGLIDRPRNIRIAGLVVGIALSVIVLISRLVLHFHSASEAVAGGLLGLMVSFSIICMLRSAPRFRFARPFIAFSLAALLIAPQTKPAPTQRWLVELTDYLAEHRTRLDTEVGGASLRFDRAIVKTHALGQLR
ncbi:phosphatase PAP2 family protein [soil metagenome]